MSVDFAHIPPVVSTLMSVAFGSVLGIASSTCLELFKDNRRNRSTRTQIASLVSVVQMQMHDAAKSGAAPSAQWISIELLSARVFSSDAAAVLRGKGALMFHTRAVELHQIRLGIESLQMKWDDLKLAMAQGEFRDTGPALHAGLARDITTMAGRGETICGTMLKILDQ